MHSAPGLTSLHRLVWISLMAALAAVGAYLHLPLGPVPFSLQVFFVLMAGFVLGPLNGALALCLYVAAGLVGLPVFSGGKSGLAHLLGPTGGYIAGFIACAALSGLAAPKQGEKLSWAKGFLWGGLGLAIIYVLGMGRLVTALDISLGKAFAVGFITFFPGDLAKLILAVLACRYLAARRLLPL